jgi:ubiquinone biosynthesis protein
MPLWFGKKTPSELRGLVESLGPTATKVGQYLALRPDLISPAHCQELLQLTDRAQPFSWEEARAILEFELGSRLRARFASIEREPFGAGSLAQVHRARLKDGSRVAVKVQRPAIESRIERDIAGAQVLARMLAAARLSSGIAPKDVVDELSAWLRQELDFRNELRNTQRLYELSAASVVARIPKPVPELSTRRVFVAEYLQGTPLTRFIGPRGPRKTEGFDPERFAVNLVETSFRQIFEYKRFHADLHPGNLLVLDGGVIGFVDFGLCDELDENMRESQRRYLAAVYNGNTEEVFRALVNVLEVDDESDVEGFRRDYLAETRQLGSGVGNPGDDAPVQSALSGYLVSLLKSARTHRLRVPHRVLSLYRTLLTLDSVVHRLDQPEALSQVGRPFFQSLQVSNAIRGLSVDGLAPTLLAHVALMRDGPRQVSQLLADLSEGSFQLPVRVSESRRVEKRRAREARLVAASMLSISLALLLQRDDISLAFGVGTRTLAVIGLFGTYVWIAVLIRRLG